MAHWASEEKNVTKKSTANNNNPLRLRYKSEPPVPSQGEEPYFKPLMDIVR